MKEEGGDKRFAQALPQPLTLVLELVAG